MTRGYIEGDGDEENPAYYLAHTWAERAMAGKRGQRLLHDLLAALDAMPEKRLVASSFACESGVCSLGALGRARGLDLSELEDIAQKIGEDWFGDAERVGELNQAAAATFDAAKSLVAEIMWRNDGADFVIVETPQQRWARMRAWVQSKLRGAP